MRGSLEETHRDANEARGDHREEGGGGGAGSD